MENNIFFLGRAMILRRFVKLNNRPMFKKISVAWYANTSINVVKNNAKIGKYSKRLRIIVSMTSNNKI